MFIIPLIKYEYSLVSRHNTNISVKASASNVSFEVSILYSFRITSYILFLFSFLQFWDGHIVVIMVHGDSHKFEFVVPSLVCFNSVIN